MMTSPSAFTAHDNTMIRQMTNSGPVMASNFLTAGSRGPGLRFTGRRRLRAAARESGHGSRDCAQRGDGEFHDVSDRVVILCGDVEQSQMTLGR